MTNRVETKRRGTRWAAAAIAAAIGFGLMAAPASADDWHGRGHKHGHYDRGWHRGHGHDRVIVERRRQVIVRDRPVYVAPPPVYAPPPTAYYVPPSGYYRPSFDFFLRLD